MRHICTVLLAFCAGLLPAASAAQYARPAPLGVTISGSVEAATLGLPSNEVGFFVRQGDTLWVSAGLGISRTLTGGASQYDWTSFDVGTEDTRQDEAISAFTADGSRAVVATGHTEMFGSQNFSVGDGLYLSSDGGMNWVHHGITDIFLDREGMTAPGGDAQCFGATFQGDTLWAAFTTEFVVRSRDFGATWERFRPDSVNNPQPNPFLDDPGNENRYLHLNYRAFDVTVLGDEVWVSTNAGVNKSTNFGRTWTNYDAVSAGLSGDFVPSIVADPETGIIWAGTQASSIDEQSLFDTPSDIFGDGVIDSLDWDLDRDNRRDRQGRSGISWTADGGNTWKSFVPADDPVIDRNFSVWGLTTHGGTVWAAGSAGGIDALLTSDDLGESWRLVPITNELGETLRSTEGLLDVSWYQGSLWVSTTRGLARSSDDGENWDFVLRFPQTRTMDTGALIAPDGVASSEMTYAFPSPFSPQRGEVARIVFAVSSAQDVEVRIYDASGALVRELESSVAAGNHTLIWDGRNGAGRRAVNGVYLYRISAGDGSAVEGKVMLLD